MVASGDQHLVSGDLKKETGQLAGHPAPLFSTQHCSKVSDRFLCFNFDPLRVLLAEKDSFAQHAQARLLVFCSGSL